MNIQRLFRGKDGELSVSGRLAAGACAGMTSTFVSNVANESTYKLNFLGDYLLHVLAEVACHTFSGCSILSTNKPGSLIIVVLL